MMGKMIYHDNIYNQNPKFLVLTAPGMSFKSYYHVFSMTISSFYEYLKKRIGLFLLIN